MLMRRGRPGLLRTVGRAAVVAGTATMTANAVSRHSNAKQEQAAQAQAYQDQQAQQQQAAQQPVQPAAQQPVAQSGSGGSIVDKLSELAKLRDSGALSEDEFGAAKAKLLA
jgi:Short C-terminal domain